MNAKIRDDTHETPYWQASRRLTGVACLLWFLLNFGVLFFAREIAQFSNWSLTVYVLAQALMLANLLLIIGYNFLIKRLRRRHAGVIE